jgi:hypothetical protein
MRGIAERTDDLGGRSGFRKEAVPSGCRGQPLHETLQLIRIDRLGYAQESRGAIAQDDIRRIGTLIP